MRIARNLVDEIVGHAREDDPNECCGMFGIDGDDVVAVYPAANIHHSPTRFEIDGRDVMRLTQEIEDRGLSMGLYHSHTKSPAYPSQTDINFAEFWPGVLWLIVSLADTDPDLRTFLIDGPQVSEVDLKVE